MSMTVAPAAWRLQLALPERSANSLMFHQVDTCLRLRSYARQASGLRRTVQPELRLALTQTTD
jgi:hypothetical protein